MIAVVMFLSLGLNQDEGSSYPGHLLVSWLSYPKQ